MAIATVSPGEEVRSEDHNALAGLLNGTANYGEPVKLYQHDDTATFALTVGNQDTDTGLIAKFQYGVVGSATTVAEIRKGGIYGKLNSTSGPIVELEAFAADATAIRGASPSEDPNDAWEGARDAIAATGGGIILLGPYTYLAPEGLSPVSPFTWVDGTIIRGAGIGATTILHRPDGDINYSTPVLFLGLSDCGIADLTVDGNWANNETFNQTEISIDGTRNWCVRVRVINFNKQAITCGGTDTMVADCVITGLAPTPYTAWDDAHYESLVGILTPGNTVCRRVQVLNNTVTGCRSSAIFIGGIGFTIMGNQVNDCHRGDDPLDTPGGCIATAPTQTSVSLDTPPQDGLIANNYVGPMPTQIGPSTLGGANGIDIDGARILCIGNIINGVSNLGITVGASLFNTRSIMIIGGSINSVNTTPGLPAAYGSTAISVLTAGGTITGLQVIGVTIAGCENAIWTGGSVSAYSFRDLILDGNTTGWTKSDAAIDWSSGGHVYINTAHARLPNQDYSSSASDYGLQVMNFSTTGYGLRLLSGPTNSQFNILSTNTSGATVLQLLGDGSLSLGGPANEQKLNVLTLTESKTLAVAAFSDTTIQKPAGAVILAVSVRVTTAISGGGVSSFSVGDSGSATRFGTTATIALTAGTTDTGTAAGAYYNPTAGAIRLTMNGGSPTAGVVRVTIHYYTITPPTS